MAFQPIVDVEANRVFAYEALARSAREDGSAACVLAQVNEQNQYVFDQSCRVKAITLASQIGLVETGAMLSINFMPGAVYSPAACIQVTLKTARKMAFPLDRLIFEITETQKVKSHNHLRDVVAQYRESGFKVALDDFGAGWSGLNLLADLPANILKLDAALIHKLEQRPRAMAIMDLTVNLSRALDLEIIAEGVETMDEFYALRECGIRLMQGHLFAKPAYEALPEVHYPEFVAAGRSSRPIARSA